MGMGDTGMEDTVALLRLKLSFTLEEMLGPPPPSQDPEIPLYPHSHVTQG